MSALDCDAIDAREKLATPGPWTWEDDDNLWSHGRGKRDYEDDDDNRTPIVQTDGGHYGPNVQDGDFIAHARTDVPALTAEVLKLQATIERVRMIATEYDSSESYAALRDIAALAGAVKLNV